ncbi:MAG: lysophospholipid acyltransferase family protein [Betaproteobacteria bacterium]|nr:lysophospholipid acyltransferase family protein [Betaproteobacteria bacterium]
MPYRLFFRLLACLPLSLLHLLGAAAGWLVYVASSSYRRLLRQNMALALGEEAAADPALRSSAIAAAGKMVLELPRIWLNPLEKAVSQIVEVHGWEHVEAAWQQKKGIVFLTPHLGCFEITAQYYATHAPITVLYRPPKQTWIRPMIETGRARTQLHLATADLSGVRALWKALKRGEAVGLLPDQAPRKGEGLWLPFFGKPAYTMTLAARLTEANATVILAWGERLPGGKGYHFHLRPPLEPITGTLEERACAINREIEALVRGCPGQYLWGYNRYKHPAGAEPPPASSIREELH